MAEILFLCHRIPYPPNKGDKVRSWHFLQHLARTHTVHLGCFVDAAEDWRYQETLRALCAECHFEPIEASAMQWRNALGLAAGKSVTESHFGRPGLRRWIDSIVSRRSIAGAFAFSSAMAQYLPSFSGDGVRRVVDFVDLDSDKWRQYAEHRRAPTRWIYELEARRLWSFERAMARLSDVAIFVTEKEADAFCKLAPESSTKVLTIRNGVDTEYFSPERPYTNPFDPDRRPIVFTGAMGYWANQDAVSWFATTVFPAIRRREPRAEFWIVGAGPPPAVKRLAEASGVRVTGTVPDVRPYLAHAAAAVAPMRVGRGIQNKVLEAMAMAKPVVASELARDGLDASVNDRQLCVASTSSSFAEALTGILSDPARAGQIGAQARALVLAEYPWSRSLRQLEELFS